MLDYLNEVQEYMVAELESKKCFMLSLMRLSQIIQLHRLQRTLVRVLHLFHVLPWRPPASANNRFLVMAGGRRLTGQKPDGR